MIPKGNEDHFTIGDLMTERYIEERYRTNSESLGVLYDLKLREDLTSTSPNVNRADENDGFFYQIDGSTFGVGSRKDGVDTAKALGSLQFDAPFSNGLTIVTSGGAKICVTYE